MRDIGEHLFPEGHGKISPDAHRDLVDGLAALSARYWGWTDDLGLTTLDERLRFFAPDNIAAEVAVDDPPLPIRVASEGWPRLAERAPALSELVTAIHADAGPRWRTRCDQRQRRSFRVIGRWAIWVVTRTVARSCSTGPTQDRVPCCGTLPGISR